MRRKRGEIVESEGNHQMSLFGSEVHQLVNDANLSALLEGRVSELLHDCVLLQSIEANTCHDHE